MENPSFCFEIIIFISFSYISNILNQKSIFQNIQYFQIVCHCCNKGREKKRKYRIVASSNPRYKLGNQRFVERSQCIRIENPLHKQSEKACMCFYTGWVRTHDFTISTQVISFSDNKKSCWQPKLRSLCNKILLWRHNMVYLRLPSPRPYLGLYYILARFITQIRRQMSLGTYL